MLMLVERAPSIADEKVFKICKLNACHDIGKTRTREMHSIKNQTQQIGDENRMKKKKHNMTCCSNAADRGDHTAASALVTGHTIRTHALMCVLHPSEVENPRDMSKSGDQTACDARPM